MVNGSVLNDSRSTIRGATHATHHRTVQMLFPKWLPTMGAPRRLELLYLVRRLRMAAPQVVVSMAVVALASMVAYLHTRIHTRAVDPSFLA
jgi:hypothetical protein